jgi:hypothetical protein
MHISFETAETIRRKKAQYCRYLDTKQWDSLQALAFPDAEMTFLEASGSVQTAGKSKFAFSSPKAFIDEMRVLFKNAQTLHQTGHGDLEQISENEVRAIWSMEDQLLFPAPFASAPIEIRGGGYYHEVWQLKDGDWLLRSLRLERTYMKRSLTASALIKLSGLL